MVGNSLPDFSELTLKEQQLLSLFLNSRDQSVSRTEILAQIWKNAKVDPKTVDVHLYNLRRKIQNGGIEIRSTSSGRWQLLNHRMNQELVR
ncbi:MAG: winged helix-turn-helix domain-containing protein [Bdellovibrionota bacterium]